MAKKRKIVAVPLVVYVEQTGRPAQPTRQEVADALIDHLNEGRPVEVLYGRDRLVQELTVIGAYSTLSADDSLKKGPEVTALRLGTDG
jgi:hypothetical protein